MPGKTYTEMTNQELNNLRYQLVLMYDNEMNSVLGGYNEEYDESDLENWDEQIRKIDDILRARPIENPRVTFSRGGGAAEAEGKPYRSDYWRCEVQDDAWVRLSYYYYDTEQEARDAFAGWCKEKEIDPATVPEKVTILS